MIVGLLGVLKAVELCSPDPALPRERLGVLLKEIHAYCVDAGSLTDNLVNFLTRVALMA
jgi:hypothetical protein